jgi:MFS family permease
MSAVVGDRPARVRRITILLALAVFVGYVDRATLSTVAPALKGELGISNAQMGLLLSAFFWIYAPAQLPGGWCAQRYVVRYVLALGLVLWSLATLGSALVNGFAILFALQLFLGLGQAAFFPCASRMLAEAAPEEERGRANALISTGLALGPMVGTLAGGLILAQFGWRWVFLSFGLASLLWLWPWLIARQPAPLPHPDIAAASPPPNYVDILRQRSAWGASLGHFAGAYSHFMMLTWLPTYLVAGQGFSLGAMAVIGGTVYFARAAGSLLSGHLSDRLILRGADVNRVRKAFILSGTAGVGTAMLACSIAGGWTAAVLLLVGGFCLGVNSPMVYSIGQTLAGPRAAGRWMGMQLFVGSCAGIAAPIVTGVILDRTGSYFWAFATAAMICAVGAFCWGVVIARVAPVAWGGAQARTIGY